MYLISATLHHLVYLVAEGEGGRTFLLEEEECSIPRLLLSAWPSFYGALGLSVPTH